MAILEILGKIGFDWQVALANLVNFLVIYWILKKYAFGPIAKIIDERKQKITDGLDQAKRAQTELQMAKSEQERITTEARLEANAIIGNAKKRGDEMITMATSKAAEEGEGIVKAAKANAAKEQEEATRQFQKIAGGLVARGVQKILQEEVTPERDQALTKRAATELTAS